MDFKRGMPVKDGRQLRIALVAVAVGLTGSAGVPASENVSCAGRAADLWLEEAFGSPQPPAGLLAGRQRFEAPGWLRDAEISSAKYAVDVRPGKSGGEVALSDIRIDSLDSADAYGAGIRVHEDGDSEIQLFLNRVLIAPGWPDWRSYGETNYDGLTFDAAGEIYGMSVSISDWNADAALDLKADRSQFVDLQITGPGNRPLRYWRPGPHDLVASRIDRPDPGPLVWFADCDRVTLRVYDTLFNGSDRLRPEHVSCERGDAPNIVYLSDDPRETGALHPLLRGCAEGG